MTSNTSITTGQRRLLRVATWRRWIVLLALSWSFIATSWSAEPVSKEYQLKAAFLYNFTKFVEWPTNRFATTNEPLVLGVLGDNPFGAELTKAVQGRTQNGRALVVSNLTQTALATNVHLLFVPRGQELFFERQLAPLHTAGVLTIGESELFANQEGIITFTTEADKIRFEINLAATETTGLKISSKLLHLAKTVRTSTPDRTP